MLTSRFIAEADEIRKLARLIASETDAACIELGFANPDQITPFDQLDAASKAVYERLAARVYARLAYHTGGGYVVVLEKSK